MNRDHSKPLIGVSACRKQIDPHPFNVVGEKYIDGVVDGADAMAMFLRLFSASDVATGVVVAVP